MFAALSGCAAIDKGHVDPRVAAQVTVTEHEPPAGCTLLGPITGGTLVVGGYEEARGDVVRNAILAGGNHVTLDLVQRPAIATVGGYALRGRLFTCPGGSPAAPVQVAALGRAHAPTATDANEINLPKAICEPKCSPGYTCQHAVCVSACNPACGAGQQCGADNTCQPAAR